MQWSLIGPVDLFVCCSICMCKGAESGVGEGEDRRVVLEGLYDRLGFDKRRRCCGCVCSMHTCR